VNSRLKETHGITLAEYNKLLILQKGTCAICGSKKSKRKSLGRLSVDHDHVTGRVRGLLCNECNLAIGYMADDPDRLVTAAFYVRRYRRKHQVNARVSALA
jgi:hypothetical protein